MGKNFLQVHQEYSRYNQSTLTILLALTATAFLASIFGSPTLVFAVLAFLATIFIAFYRPVVLLATLLFYIPFEPFILKWLHDGIYFYARYYSELVIYILLAVVIWRLVSGLEKWTSTRADLPFFLFLVAIIISGIVNLIDSTTFILGTRQIIRFILLYFITIQIKPSKRWIKLITSGLLYIVLFQVILGFAQYFFGERLDMFLLPAERRTFGELELTGGTDYFWDPGERIFTTFGRYDQFGIFLAFHMLFLVAILYEPTIKARIREWALPLLLISLPVLALSYSRSAWFGFLLGFIFISYYLYKDKRVPYIIAGSIAVLGAYIAFSGIAVNQLIDVPGQTLYIRLFEAFSFERWRGEYFGLGRVFWIVQTFTAVLPAAPIFGHGPATYGGGAVSALQNTAVYDSLGLPFGVYGTQGMIDNNWLSLLGELGLFGFAIFSWLYFSFFKLGLTFFKKSRDTFTKTFTAGMLSAILAVSINAFLATFFEVRTLGPYLWVGLAFMVLLAKYEGIDEYEDNTSK